MLGGNEQTLIQQNAFSKCHGMICLARGDEDTKRRWVPVLEEAEFVVTRGRNLNRLGGTGSASSGADNVRVAGSDVADLSEL